MPENDEITEKKRKKRELKNEIARINPNVTDGELGNLCRVWAKLLENNLAAFQALDPQFTPAFTADWRARVEAFEKMPTNEYMEDLQMEKKEILEKKRTAFFQCVTDLAYYVNKAFPDRKRIEMEFGLHKLRTQEAKRGIRDITIAYATKIVMDNYNAELLAGGMPAGFPVQYENALGEYAEAEVLHQFSLLQSIRATTDRVYAFNALYKTHQMVLSAAEAVFDGDEVMMKQFRI